MWIDDHSLTQRLLSALPPPVQQRLSHMGFGQPLHPLSAECLLRRAMGEPARVHLIDLELLPSAFFGRSVQTLGTLHWPLGSEGPAGVGRLLLAPTLLPCGSRQLLRNRAFRLAIHGIVLPLIMPEVPRWAEEPSRAHEIFVACLVPLALRVA